MTFKTNEHSVGLDKLRKSLDYDPKTGVFTWKDRPWASPCANARDFGKKAGSLRPSGYISIQIDGVSCFAHRLAWFHFYGHPADDMIDHIDRNKANNAICNLRLANQSQNMINCGLRSTNKSGFRGVSYHNHSRGSKRWRATITVDGEQIFLGNFYNPEDAARAYAEASKGIFGEFAV